MVEFIFPAAATLALVLVAIPLSTLLSKALLIALRLGGRARQSESDPRSAGVRSAGESGRYLLVLAPVLVPALWLMSASVHHAESPAGVVSGAQPEGVSTAALICLVEGVSEATCGEPLWIAILVAAAVITTFLWRRHVATRTVIRGRLSRDSSVLRRVHDLCRQQPQLRAIQGRIRVVEGRHIRTVGLLRPGVEVGAELVEQLDGSALVAALLHEREHVRGLDPLRFVVASVCQSLNPLGFLLAPDLHAWRAGREAICDEAAVHHGADPCSLAEALIAVARPPEPLGAGVADLGRGGGIALLRVRITLLMQYVTTQPRCRCSRTTQRLAVVAVVLLAAIPHYCGEQMLVDLHLGAERAVLASRDAG